MERQSSRTRLNGLDGNGGTSAGPGDLVVNRDDLGAIGQSAMGNALEAAVTGRVPGDEDAKPVEHTKSMASVMEKVVEKVGTSAGLAVDDGPLVGIAPNLGNMAAEYMPDLQATAENGADRIKPFGEKAEFDKQTMAQFLGAVGGAVPQPVAAGDCRPWGSAAAAGRDRRP
ncbi:hypothetical protein [Streptomyces sp. NPDC086147]|uniref:hypothetical protein n=1 Tax=Streptomyces sp. NPDC086147 TaxID=3155295 RepID=UPI00344EE5B7